MLVVDASVIIELLFRTKLGDKILDVLFKSNTNLIAPELLSIECIQVMRRFISSKELSLVRSREVFQDLKDLPIKYYPHQILLDRIWELKNNFTAYDAAYLALAENLNTPLLTADSAFNKGFGRLHTAKIIYVKN